MADETKKWGRDNYVKVSQVFALVVVPLVVGFGPAAFNWTEKDKELNLEYTKLAIRILENTQSSSDLRQWATDILDETAPAQPNVDVSNALIMGDVYFPPDTANRFVWDGQSVFPPNESIVAIPPRPKRNPLLTPPEIDIPGLPEQNETPTG